MVHGVHVIPIIRASLFCATKVRVLFVALLYSHSSYNLAPMISHKAEYRVAQKTGPMGHPISLQIFWKWKLHDRIPWKLVNFCKIICWTQSLIFYLKISSRCGATYRENWATVVYSHCIWASHSSCVFARWRHSAMKFLNKKVNDCVQHRILQKFTNFHAIRLWSFQNICNEIGWPRFFAPPCI